IPKGSSEGYGSKPQVPDESKGKSAVHDKSDDDWGSDEEEVIIYSDDKITESDKEVAESKKVDEETADEEEVHLDEEVHTKEEEQTDDEHYDEEVHEDEEVHGDDEKYADDEKDDEEINDTAKGDEEMADAEKVDIGKSEEEKVDNEQVGDDQVDKDDQAKDDKVEDVQVGALISVTQNEKPQLPSSTPSLSLSSDYGNQFLNVSSDISLQAPLLDVLVFVIPTMTMPTPSITTPIIEVQATTVTITNPSLIVLLRLSELKRKVEALSRVDHFKVIINEVKNHLPKVVSNFVESRMENTVHDVLQKDPINLKKKDVSKIRKIKLEHANKEKVPKYSAIPFDQATMDEYNQKDILFKMMRESKSYDKHPTYRALYDGLVQSLLMDEDDMDKGVVEPSTQKRREDVMVRFLKSLIILLLLLFPSKIIVDRVKEGLGDIVSINQTAFVPGRRISDNILLTQELMRNYHRRRGPPRCAFKVDIQKAYDTIDWKFLENILVGFGFHPKMVHWIMVCVSGASYSICVNGNLHGFFKGKRGLWQGDPLSPYIFTLVMEVLTLILQRRVHDSDEFQYHHLCEQQRIINLCFADDLFLFARGHPTSVSVIMDALDEFKQVSGLVPSIPKSTAFFSNVPNAIKASILNSMPFAEGTLSVRYLGVPLISSRLLYRDCKILVEKLESRVNDFRNKCLSLAGHLQLIRLVLSSMHIYWASIFILPTRIVHDLEQLMRGFLWCQGEMKKGTTKVAWDSVCLPKLEGVLGIRRIDDFNVALMATHIWCILTHKESLWVKWVHTWDDVCSLKDMISNRDIARSGFSFDDSVSNIISNGTWRWPFDWLSRFPIMAQVQVSVLINNIDDVILWRGRDAIMRPFSVRCVSDTIRSRAGVVDWYFMVWFPPPHCIPRHAIHMWLVLKQKLKTQDWLRQWDVGPNTDLYLLRCPLCDLVTDSHDHLFLECSFSSQVWSRVRGLCGMDYVSPRLMDVCDFIKLKIVKEADFVTRSDCSSHFIHGAAEAGYVQVQEDVYQLTAFLVNIFIGETLYQKEKEKKRRRRTDAELQKKSSTSKESSKGNTPPKTSKTGKYVTIEESVEEPVHEVVMNVDEPILDDVVNDVDQPQDDVDPNNDKQDHQSRLTRTCLQASQRNLQSSIELEYTMDRCYIALTCQLDWTNPEGDRCPYDLSKSLPLQGSQGHLTIPVYFFFKNDLEYLKTGNTERKYTVSITKTKAARYELESIEEMIPNQWNL
ncbi:putative RNA-directed DNA polymerase, partial [Tanacetum coccineum]